ncbi:MULTISPECIES: hypothetical protein [unclassified Campylobacter]|uniref:hypothetical protein n=1 Tax=unclassified Campylobacter TaxID=2593542 RepID=UPI001472C818|nr:MULTISPECIES: hypothetical protein [unclassified Campylobacter]QKG28985.1 hypothetical protein CDOMF_0712 [Campylobacter sp. RM16187]
MGTQLIEQTELKEMIEFKERIENNTVVEFWENSEDFERLANTTVKTMRYVNEEQIREFAQGINQMNEKILNLTFEGVKKHYEKQHESVGKKQKINIACAFAIGLIVGAVLVKLFF